MLIRFKNKAFNTTTFLVFAGIGCAVLALALPFEFFRPEIELLAELFADTRIERDAAFVEIVLRFGPWFVASAFVCIGAYLASERTK